MWRSREEALIERFVPYECTDWALHTWTTRGTERQLVAGVGPIPWSQTADAVLTVAVRPKGVTTWELTSLIFYQHRFLPRSNINRCVHQIGRHCSSWTNLLPAHVCSCMSSFAFAISQSEVIRVEQKLWTYYKNIRLFTCTVIFCFFALRHFQ